MTYDEAVEKTLTMESYAGMYLTITKGNQDNENSYYPDYKHHRSMSGMGGMIEREPMMVEAKVPYTRRGKHEYYMPEYCKMNTKYNKRGLK